MATTNKTVVNKVARKSETGEMELAIPFGLAFDNIVDTRDGKGNYSLAQFFDNYQAFASKYTYIAKGPSQPKNSRAMIWIDTAHSNLD